MHPRGPLHRWGFPPPASPRSVPAHGGGVRQRARTARPHLPSFQSGLVEEPAGAGRRPTEESLRYAQSNRSPGLFVGPQLDARQPGPPPAGSTKVLAGPRRLTQPVERNLAEHSKTEAVISACPWMALPPILHQKHELGKAPEALSSRCLAREFQETGPAAPSSVIAGA